jgi:choline-sulfatase
MTFGPFTQNPNIIILMTDQQRAFRHFPETWIAENLQNFTKLQSNGITFNNAICNASRCSPSRSVLYTGQYTWQTGVFDVGGTLPPDINTIGKLMEVAGYEMVYKGKWHLSGDPEAFDRPVDPAALSQASQLLQTNYNIGGWNPPDAGVAGPGNFSSLPVNNRNEPSSVPTTDPQVSSPYFTLGGSLIENDDRYVIGPNATEEQESAIDFLNNYQSSGSTNPFCLAVSLVNPHDINVFPDFVQSMKYFEDRDVWQNYTDFKLPASYHKDTLEQKPSVQLEYVNSTNVSEPFGKTGLTHLEYLKFYAYLHVQPDQLFDQLLGTMSEDLLNNTIIIRLADHGEMGMSHHGMRFKDLNAYQETMNVPLVFSNPVLFPQAQSVDQLVGLVDLMPTLATITGLDEEQRKGFQFKGIDFSSVLLDPNSPTQDRMLYTYDDMVPSTYVGYIRTLVKVDYKFSVYYQTSDGTPTGNVEATTFQYELYDMKKDPDEITNLLPVGESSILPFHLNIQDILYNELTDKMKQTETTPNGWPTTLPG